MSRPWFEIKAILEASGNLSCPDLSRLAVTCPRQCGVPARVGPAQFTMLQQQLAAGGEPRKIIGADVILTNRIGGALRCWGLLSSG